MNSRSTWVILSVMAAALLAVGAGPSVPPWRAPEARAVPVSPSVPARAPVSLVPPSIAPAPTVASGAAVSQDPHPSSGTSGNASGPGGTAGPAAAPNVGAGSGDKYEVPVGLAPVTNRSTCRHAPRDCCDETKDWCLAEGFVWQSCKNCYCGSQCMAPALFKD